MISNDMHLPHDGIKIQLENMWKNENIIYSYYYENGLRYRYLGYNKAIYVIFMVQGKSFEVIFVCTKVLSY